MAVSDQASPPLLSNGRGSAFAAFWTIAAFPLSLTSPGATVAGALVALYGLYRWAWYDPLPRDLRRVAAITLAGWLMLVVVDFLNGGWSSNLATMLNYLPFLAAAPLAFGIRSSGVRMVTIDRAMQATLLIAAANSLIQVFLLDVYRPGGLNLNPIPYAFVLLLWGVMLLSRGLTEGRAGWSSVAIALLGIVPILLAGSRVVWICTAIAYPLAIISWSVAAGRLRQVAPILGGGLLILVLAGFTEFVQLRVSFLWVEISDYLANGTIRAQSFGHRLELVRSGFHAFLDAPFIGHGIVEAMSAALAHTDAGAPDISMHAHLHNEYVAHLVGYGVFGLAFLMGYFWLFVRWSLDCSVVSWRRAGIVIAVALAIYGAAEIHFHMDPISGPMAIVAGLLLAFRRDDAAAASDVSR